MSFHEIYRAVTGGRDRRPARDTAWLYNMMDRGTLEPGKKADLNGAAASVRSAFLKKIFEPR